MAKKSSSRRYAQALFQIGAEEDNVKILLEDTEKVNESLKEEKLVYLLDSPKLKISEKVKLIDDIFRKKINRVL